MPKTLPVIILLSFSFCHAHAQISKGSLFLGGRLQYSKTEANMTNVETKNTFLTAAPAIGMAIKENIVLGVELNYQSGSQKNSGFTSQNQKSYGGGLFLRRYFPLGKSFYLFGQGNAGISFFDNKDYSPGYLQKNEGYRVNLGVYPGISYAVNRKLHIESGLNNLLFAEYSSATGYRNSNEESKSRNINVGTSLGNPISLNLGLRIILGK